MQESGGLARKMALSRPATGMRWTWRRAVQATVYSESFEVAGVAGWGNYGGAPTLSRETATAGRYLGTGSLKVVATTTNSCKPMSPVVTVTPNTTYLITVKLSSAQAKTFILQVEQYASGGYVTSSFGGQLAVPATTGFTTLSFSLTTGATVNQLYIIPLVDTGAGGTVAIGDSFWVDDVTVA